MPGFVLTSQGQPYMNAVSSLASKTGDWISVGDGLEVVTFDYEFAMGAGNITGTITVEHVAQLSGSLPSTGTRVLLPLGSLHTNLTQATLASAPNPSLAVTLTAVVTGRLALHLGKVPAGHIRSLFNFTSGAGASPNTLTCYATGWRPGNR